MRTAEIPLQCLQESKPPVERVVYFIPIRRQKDSVRLKASAGIGPYRTYSNPRLTENFN